MSTVKAIALLVIGAILGYSLSFIGEAHNKENFIDDELITTEVPLSMPMSKTASKLIDNKQEIIANNHVSVISSKTKDIISDNNEITQQHLDLVEKHQALKQQYHKSLSKISTLKHQLGEFDNNEATDEEMESLVPQPFKFFLSSFRGETRNEIFDFHNQEDDLDWGYDKQNNISDYVLTHYEGTSIELISVTCKQPRCEILVTEKQEDAWNNIMKDMTQQSWWKFSSFTSSTKSNAENEMSIYAFLSQ